MFQKAFHKWLSTIERLDGGVDVDVSACVGVVGDIGGGKSGTGICLL